MTNPTERPPLTFGPVPSRRLGQSLGVNLIPPKRCTYSCVYCQVGRTTHMALARRAFYRPEEILEAVRRRLAECDRDGLGVDAVTVLGDGEPTLDVNLGTALELLRGVGRRVAVISNGSLLDRPEVRADLARADWVSVKVDAASPEPWRRVDRPHGRLRLDAIHEGLRVFARELRGTLVTETMLVAGVNDGAEDSERLAGLLAGVAPAIAYLGVPIRPPAEPWVSAPAAEAVVRAYSALTRLLPRVELLTGEPLEPHPRSSDLERDLLATTAVHPLDEDAVAQLGGGARAALDVAAGLVATGQLAEATFRGKRFFLRPTGRDRRQPAAGAPSGPGETSNREHGPSPAEVPERDRAASDRASDRKGRA